MRLDEKLDLFIKFLQIVVLLSVFILIGMCIWVGLHQNL